MARATGANAKLYAAAESVYGTKPSGGFRKFPFHSVDVRAQQDLQESTLLGQGRDAQDPSLGAVSVSGRLVVPVDLRNIGFWLKMLLGAPASVDNMGVVTHTYLSGAQSLPSFSLETVMPEVPEYVVSLGALVNSLQLDFQRTGEAQAQLEVMGQGETSNSTSQHGTPDADHALTRFSTFQGQIDIDGSQAANVLSGSVSFSNGLDPVETIRADGLIDGIDPGQATATGNIRTRFADRTLLDKATSNTPVELTFRHKIDNDNLLEFIFHRVFLPRPKTPVSGPGGIEVDFAFQAAYDAVSGQMMTVNLINDVLSY